MAKRTNEEAGLDAEASEDHDMEDIEDERSSDEEEPTAVGDDELESIPTPSEEMSVRDLRRLLNHHKRSRTV
jgi:hypothetical protein